MNERGKTGGKKSGKADRKERGAFIQAQNVVKTYQDVGEEIVVLRGVDLRIREREILTVMGESGAGKSTLLHLLGGLDRPTEGQVIHGGVDITELSSQEMAAYRSRHIGFVFQFHHLMPEFTALENAAMAGMIGGRSRSEALDRARELLDAVGLSGRLGHRPTQLSGGERQRVALARALMNEPRVVLADEPTGNLDRKTSGAVHDQIWELRELLGQTFVIVTHNPQLAERSDRTIELADGRARPMRVET